MSSVFAQLRDAIAEEFTAAGITVPIELGRIEDSTKDSRTRIVLVPVRADYEQGDLSGNQVSGATRVRQRYTKRHQIDAKIYVRRANDDEAREMLDELSDALAIAAWRAGACVPGALDYVSESEAGYSITHGCALAVLGLQLDCQVPDEIAPLTIIEDFEAGVIAQLTTDETILEIAVDA